MEDENSEKLEEINSVLRNHKHLGYDFTKTLTTKTYAGYVNSDGTAGWLPTGWTSTRRGAGQYTITHNLNSANYTCCCISYATVAFPKLNAVNVNDVQPDFITDVGGLTDAKFYFILTLF